MSNRGAAAGTQSPPAGQARIRRRAVHTGRSGSHSRRTCTEVPVNPRSRRTALHAIGVIAILASVNALAHSYAGLYDWAVHHRLGGWQAMSWPAEIDGVLAGAELALYTVYLDGSAARHTMVPWAS